MNRRDIVLLGLTILLVGLLVWPAGASHRDANLRFTEAERNYVHLLGPYREEP